MNMCVGFFCDTLLSAANCPTREANHTWLVRHLPYGCLKWCIEFHVFNIPTTVRIVLSARRGIRAEREADEAMTCAQRAELC